jgi:hypothetical protein
MVLLAVACALAAGVVAFVVRAPGSIGQRASRATAPAAPSNLCGLLPADLVDRLVPHHEPPSATRYGGAAGPNARCRIQTDGPSAPTLASASLDVSLDRYAADAGDEPRAAVERCRRDRPAGADRTVSVRDVAGVGELACASVDTGPADRWHPLVSVAAVRGRDVVRVLYSAGPMDAATAERAAIVVAGEVFAGL